MLSLLQTQDRYGYEISEFLSAHIDIAGSSMSTNGTSEMRGKDEALQRAPRQIQEQFQHRMVSPVFNRKCRTGRAEGLLPEGQDVRSCRAQFPSRPGF